jgi:sulfite reductase (NADPH) flavoprotein alpha-component
LYENEWESYENDGILNDLDLAWSRDQEKKVYVQHKMLEKKAQLWSWLQDGAIFYVCGDASRMAKDVDQALRTIAHEEGAYERRGCSCVGKKSSQGTTLP